MDDRRTRRQATPFSPVSTPVDVLRFRACIPAEAWSDAGRQAARALLPVAGAALGGARGASPRPAGAGRRCRSVARPLGGRPVTAVALQ
jgi:hypothetical protein